MVSYNLSRHKRRVLCYVLSHAIAWNSVHARVELLEILRNVPHRVKLPMFLPLVQSIVSGDHTLWDDEHKAIAPAYFQLMLEAYDATVIPELIEQGSGSWSTFVRLMRLTFTNGEFLR